MKQVQDNYLKHWKIVREWVKAQYKVGNQDIDMLLMMDGEGRFTLEYFMQIGQFFDWGRRMFFFFTERGLVERFRDGKKGEPALYQLTPHGKSIVKAVYQKLEGEEIPVTRHANPFFKDKAGWLDKRYQRYIKEMNHEIKENKLKNANNIS